MAKCYETAIITSIGENSCRVEYLNGHEEAYQVRAKNVIQLLNNDGWWVSATSRGPNKVYFFMTREKESIPNE